MKARIVGAALMTMSALALAAPASVVYPPGVFPNVKTPEAAVFRGNIVFEHYCVLCHGIKADGNGRAAALHTPRPSNLVLSDKNDRYLELIVRQGGAALGRSEFMPRWVEELTDEQITDVVAYLRSIQHATAGAR